MWAIEQSKNESYCRLKRNRRTSTPKRFHLETPLEKRFRKRKKKKLLRSPKQKVSRNPCNQHLQLLMAQSPVDSFLIVCCVFLLMYDWTLMHCHTVVSTTETAWPTGFDFVYKRKKSGSIPDVLATARVVVQRAPTFTSVGAIAEAVKRSTIWCLVLGCTIMLLHVVSTSHV